MSGSQKDATVLEPVQEALPGDATSHQTVSGVVRLQDHVDTAAEILTETDGRSPQQRGQVLELVTRTLRESLTASSGPNDYIGQWIATHHQTLQRKCLRALWQRLLFYDPDATAGISAGALEESSRLLLKTIIENPDESYIVRTMNRVLATVSLQDPEAFQAGILAEHSSSADAIQTVLSRLQQVSNVTAESVQMRFVVSTADGPAVLTQTLFLLLESLPYDEKVQTLLNEFQLPNGDPDTEEESPTGLPLIKIAARMAEQVVRNKEEYTGPLLDLSPMEAIGFDDRPREEFGPLWWRFVFGWNPSLSREQRCDRKLYTDDEVSALLKKYGGSTSCSGFNLFRDGLFPEDDVEGNTETGVVGSDPILGNVYYQGHQSSIVTLLYGGATALPPESIITRCLPETAEQSVLWALASELLQQAPQKVSAEHRRQLEDAAFSSGDGTVNTSSEWVEVIEWLVIHDEVSEETVETLVDDLTTQVGSILSENQVSVSISAGEHYINMTGTQSYSLLKSILHSDVISRNQKQKLTECVTAYLSENNESGDRARKLVLPIIASNNNLLGDSPLREHYYILTNRLKGRAKHWHESPTEKRPLNRLFVELIELYEMISDTEDLQPPMTIIQQVLIDWVPTVQRIEKRYATKLLETVGRSESVPIQRKISFINEYVYTHCVNELPNETERDIMNRSLSDIERATDLDMDDQYVIRENLVTMLNHLDCSWMGDKERMICLKYLFASDREPDVDFTMVGALEAILTDEFGRTLREHRPKFADRIKQHVGEKLTNKKSNELGAMEIYRRL